MLFHTRGDPISIRDLRKCSLIRVWCDVKNSIHMASIPYWLVWSDVIKLSSWPEIHRRIWPFPTNTSRSLKNIPSDGLSERSNDDWTWKLSSLPKDISTLCHCVSSLHRYQRNTACWKDRLPNYLLTLTWKNISRIAMVISRKNHERWNDLHQKYSEENSETCKFSVPVTTH